MKGRAGGVKVGMGVAEAVAVASIVGVMGRVSSTTVSSCAASNAPGSTAANDGNGVSVAMISVVGGGGSVAVAAWVAVGRIVGSIVLTTAALATISCWQLVKANSKNKIPTKLLKDPRFF